MNGLLPVGWQVQLLPDVFDILASDYCDLEVN